MQDKIAIIIQARSGSSRLANKVLLPFYKNLSILDIIIQRLKNNKRKIQLILATTNNIGDNKVADLAYKHNILQYRGDENNVLQRFIQCAQAFSYSKIIRVCADNPFILIKYVDELIEIGVNNTFDYISYKNSVGTPVIKTHFGLFAEFVTLNALKKIQQNTNSKLFYEHVTNYIYSNPDIFKINLIPLPDLLINRNDLRFTCDTIEDFNMLKNLYSQYVNTYHTENIELEKLLAIADFNKEYKEIMLKGIKQFEK